MSLRRQEKIKRVIRDNAAEIIQNRLSDPRITGFVTVTEVSISPDLKNAQIYLSIMAENEKAAKKTFIAIEHASSHIRSLIAEKLTMRYIPSMTFHEDKKIKQTLEVLKIIEQASQEYKIKDAQQADDDQITSSGGENDER